MKGPQIELRGPQMNLKGPPNKPKGTLNKLSYGTDICSKQKCSTILKSQNWNERRRDLLDLKKERLTLTSTTRLPIDMYRCIYIQAFDDVTNGKNLANFAYFYLFLVSYNTKNFKNLIHLPQNFRPKKKKLKSQKSKGYKVTNFYLKNFKKNQ